MNHTDQSLFLDHFLRAEREIRAYLYAATRDVHTTDDLLQEVSRTLLEKWERYDHSRPFTPWAVGFAHMQVLKWRQQRARSRETPTDVLSEEALGMLAQIAASRSGRGSDRAAFLADCLERVRGVGRRVLELRYGQDLKVHEVAELIGKQVAAVEMMLVRVRRTLRDCVEQKMARLEGSTTRGTVS